MFVRKDFRGKGVAQKLLETLLEKMEAPFKIYLSTKGDLALAAKKFYLRNGFAIITKKELPEGFPFLYEDDLFMKNECLYI